MEPVATDLAPDHAPGQEPDGQPKRARPPGVRPERGGRGPATAELLVVAAAVAVVGAGVVLRFATTSKLWLDEALTVNIARLPLGQIHGALRRDGAPPLFYVLLHLWMLPFGTSDVAVRSLSGVLACATLPLVWVAARRIGGKPVALAALLLSASSPFAVRYATEARMYALVAFLVAAGIVALQRALVRPTIANLVALCACSAGLLYSHYWALYLVGVTGLWLMWRVWRRTDKERTRYLVAFGAVSAGCLAFIPWIPTFAYQSSHTGTPWATPANFSAMVNAISSFAGGASNQGRALGLLYFALAGLGVFGIASGRYLVELDLRTRPRGRAYALCVVATLAVAIVGGYATRSAFQARYAMVVFVPLVLLVALGSATFSDRNVRAGVLGAAVLFGLAGSATGVTAQRTEAPAVAQVLAELAQPGDVIAYCPDQLGPDVSRLLPSGRYQQVAFPRGNAPQFVDWVDYAKAVTAASAAQFARHLVSMSAPTRQIWLVWMGGYQAFGTKCETVETTLLADPALGAHEIVVPHTRYYEPMELVRFVHLAPTGASGSG